MGPRHRRRNCAFAPCFGVGAIGVYDVWEYDLEVTCDTGINFDDVEFKNTGKYKVSCLKKDGSVLATGEVEII